jgi:hypothetical protein
MRTTIYSPTTPDFQRIRRHKVSSDWFDFWLSPATAVRNAPFIRTVRGVKVRSQLREKDVAFLRMACSLPNDGEPTPEFKRALIEYLLASQEADGAILHEPFYALPHDHLLVVLDQRPKAAPAPPPDEWEKAEETRRARRRYPRLAPSDVEIVEAACQRSRLQGGE